MAPVAGRSAAWTSHLALLLPLVARPARGHMPGGAVGLPGLPANAYHTDQLGGNVWVFNGSDPRIHYMQQGGRDGAQFPAWHPGHKQLSVGNKTIFFDALNALVPWEFNGKADGTDEVVDSIVEGATFTRPYRGGVEQRHLPPLEVHLIYDEMLTDFPPLDGSLLTLSNNPKQAINQSQLKNSTVHTKSDHIGYMVTDTFLAEQLLTTLALNRFPSHVLDQYVNRTVAWTAPYVMTSCTVQLYVLLPYNNIIEFDIAYYDRYREKLPELNLPHALYWRGAHEQVSLEESMAAAAETPRTEFNTYLCNLTWNSTLRMTFQQAGTNGNTGPIVDNRNGVLNATVERDLRRNASFYNETQAGAGDLITLDELRQLPYDDSGTSFAVADADLSGSYGCVYVASASHGSSMRPGACDAERPGQRAATLELFPMAGSGSVYGATWSQARPPEGRRLRSPSPIDGGRRCSGVAAKLSLGPQPEVFSMSIGLAGGCGRAGDGPSTMFLDVRSNATASAGGRRLHPGELDGDEHHDQGHSYEHHHGDGRWHSHEHSHAHGHGHGHSHRGGLWFPEEPRERQLLLDGVWASGDGSSYLVACKRTREKA